MTEVHEEETRLEAWIQATNSVMSDDYKQDVILHIDSPDEQHEDTSEVFEELNGLYDEADMEPIHTVAEWIFPGWLYTREGMEGVYETYPEQLDDMQHNRWGTYFERMIKRKDPETGETFNPLKDLIEKMHRANHDGQTFHSCYDIDLSAGSFGMSLYDPSTDRNKIRGLPCLSHLSFKLYEGDVHLTALYRSHDYRFKVIGNLLGLARLQSCVANEVDAGVGQLVVHSSRAMIDDDKPKKGKFTDLVDRWYRDMNNHSLSAFD
ncbi:hypothetical protein [Natrinema sp. H-ect4]|uniref:hypothetical protein n=1 Tax=Natrinema sp. H-ect4 TaxID=3242699 RepID=UPI0035A87700